MRVAVSIRILLVYHLRELGGPRLGGMKRPENFFASEFLTLPEVLAPVSSAGSNGGNLGSSTKPIWWIIVSETTRGALFGYHLGADVTLGWGDIFVECGHKVLLGGEVLRTKDNFAGAVRHHGEQAEEEFHY